MIDNYKHKGLRRRMIDELREMGISNDEVLQVMGEIPRHTFMDSAFAEHAYQNKAFPIGLGQTISQPYTVAFQTQLLGPYFKGLKVLEIGTGSGYQTAVLAMLGAKVYSIERHKPLHQKAKKHLKDFGLSAYLSFGDGFKGMPGYAPFDAVLVTCGAPKLPELLKSQLKSGGKIIIPVDISDGVQEMRKYQQNQDGTWFYEDLGTFRFVPMVEKRAGGR